MYIGKRSFREYIFSACASKLFFLSYPFFLRSAFNAVRFEAKYAQISDDIALVQEISSLATPTNGIESHDATADEMNESSNAESLSLETDETSDTSSTSENNDYQYHVLNNSQREIIRNHLEEWEEPTPTKSPPVSRKSFS